MLQFNLAKKSYCQSHSTQHYKEILQLLLTMLIYYTEYQITVNAPQWYF